MAEEDSVYEITTSTDSPEKTRALGRFLAQRFEGGEVIALNGPLGVGKTVFVQGLALGLGIAEAVKSPSFVLERIYRGRLTMHHFDFYRLSREDVDEAGFLWDVEESSVIVIEWAQRLSEFDQWTLNVRMEFSARKLDEYESKRSITIETRAPHWKEILAKLKEGAGF